MKLHKHPSVKEEGGEPEELEDAHPTILLVSSRHPCAALNTSSATSPTCLHYPTSCGVFLQNINRSRMYGFRALVKQCGLFDLGFSGPAYTWTNKRFASKPTFERLDRCLVNAEWCAANPISNVYNMPIIHNLSDHAAILLSTEGRTCNIKCSFKFENW